MFYKDITAAAVKRTRKALGETQAQFAKRMGINQGTISRWEAGDLPTDTITQDFLRGKLEDIWRVVPVRQ